MEYLQEREDFWRAFDWHVCPHMRYDWYDWRGWLRWDEVELYHIILFLSLPPNTPHAHYQPVSGKLVGRAPSFALFPVDLHNPDNEPIQFLQI